MDFGEEHINNQKEAIKGKYKRLYTMRVAPIIIGDVGGGGVSDRDRDQALVFALFLCTKPVVVATAAAVDKRLAFVRL